MIRFLIILPYSNTVTLLICFFYRHIIVAFHNCFKKYFYLKTSKITPKACQTDQEYSDKMPTSNNFERFPPHSMIFYAFEHYVLKYSLSMTLSHYTVTKLQSKLSQELLTSITTNTSQKWQMQHSPMNKQYILQHWWFFLLLFMKIKLKNIHFIPKYMTYHQALQFCIFSWLKNKLQKILTTHRDHLDMLLLQKIEHYTNYWSLKHTQNITSYLLNAQKE